MRSELLQRLAAEIREHNKTASSTELGSVTTFQVYDSCGRKTAELDCRLMVGDYLRPVELRRVPKVLKF